MKRSRKSQLSKKPEQKDLRPVRNRKLVDRYQMRPFINDNEEEAGEDEMEEIEASASSGSESIIEMINLSEEGSKRLKNSTVDST